MIHVDYEEEQISSLGFNGFMSLSEWSDTPNNIGDSEGLPTGLVPITHLKKDECSLLKSIIYIGI